jgi:hypothetical protein
MSGSFHANLSFSGPEVLEKKFFLDSPAIFLHVCDNLPFEDGLAL